MTPDEAIRAAHASGRARDQEMLERITGLRRREPEPEAGNGETLPDAAALLADAVALQEGDEENGD